MKQIKTAINIVAVLLLVGTLSACTSPAHNPGDGMAQYKNNTAGSPYTPKGYQDPVYVPVQ
jgi:hypothetical protein